MKVQCLYDELLSVDDLALKRHPKNRNKHPDDQIERLASILVYQGWRYPIKISNQTGLITSGHGRLFAALHNKWTHCPVNYQDYDNPEQEYADVQADNAIASWAELDMSGINTDLGDLGPDFDVAMLGLKDFTVDPAEKLPPGIDEDEVPDAVQPKTKTGDIYTLGNHRLLCGDSTSIDAVEKLMNGEKADMVFTDPPYDQVQSGGTGFNQTRPNWQKHKADSLNKFDPSVMFSILEILCPKSGYFFANRTLLPTYLDWIKNKDIWDLLVMTKLNPIPTKNKKFLSDIEYLLFFRDRESFFDDTLEYDFYRKNRSVSVKGGEFGHPTQKQIDYIEPYQSISCAPKGNVVDLFGGSGSTLIACEKTDRRCFMMELDPHYCDVIVARWEKYTGQKAELIPNDLP